MPSEQNPSLAIFAGYVGLVSLWIGSVVVTHHVPSFELVAPEFKGSPLNGAFAVELGNYIAASPIEYWIYGHSHRNIDKIIGNTRCVSNQLGYVFGNEHSSFNTSAYIEITG